MPYRATLVADRLEEGKSDLDVLSDLFNEMYLSGEIVACFDLTAPWGISMPPRGGIFHAIDNGDCWIRLIPDGEPFKGSGAELVGKQCRWWPYQVAASHLALLPDNPGCWTMAS